MKAAVPHTMLDILQSRKGRSVDVPAAVDG